MDEPLFLCGGCGERKPERGFPKRKGSALWEMSRRCHRCRYSKDPDIRGFHGAAPGLDRLLAEQYPRLLREMAAELSEMDTPNPPYAFFESLVLKRLEEPILQALNKARVTGDIDVVNKCLDALEKIRRLQGESVEAVDWRLESPAGATDSE